MQRIIPTKETIVSRTIKFAKIGGPEVLEFVETEVTAPGPHEVRIEVKAIGINRAESMFRNDKYIESPRSSRRAWGTKPPASSTPWARTSLASRQATRST